MNLTHIDHVRAERYLQGREVSATLLAVGRTKSGKLLVTYLSDLTGEKITKEVKRPRIRKIKLEYSTKK